jgi:hypothetical protein
MKFGYRDRIILLIVSIIVIFAVGIFVFIKPKWEKLNTNQETLDTDKENWEKKLAQFNLIPTRQEAIKKKYTEANDIAANFTDEMTSVELDEFLRKEFLNKEDYQKDGVMLKTAYSVSDEQTATMNYYYRTPSIVTYPLYEYADLDGSLKKAAKEKRHDAEILAGRTAQIVGVGSSEFTLLINRKDTMAIVDAVKKYAEDHKDAMMIRSIEMKECDFNENIEDENGEHEETYIDADGNEQTRMVKNNNKNGNNNNNGNDQKKKDFTEVKIRYDVYYMQEPTEPDVGPEYKSEIWDGDGWRTAVAVTEEKAAE